MIDRKEQKQSPQIPRLLYEHLIARFCGEEWRDTDVDGGIGIAIVRSVLDGMGATLYDLSAHLDLSNDVLRPAFTRLNLNGVFLRNRLHLDRTALNKNDVLAWCYYAGIASGATGNVVWEPKKKDRS